MTPGYLSSNNKVAIYKLPRIDICHSLMKHGLWEKSWHSGCDYIEFNSGVSTDGHHAPAMVLGTDTGRHQEDEDTDLSVEELTLKKGIPHHISNGQLEGICT